MCDESRCIKKFEKYMNFVENGNSELMRSYGAKEIINLATNEPSCIHIILERICCACHSQTWQIRVSATKIFEILLDIYISHEEGSNLLSEFFEQQVHFNGTFDAIEVITMGKPLFACADNDENCSNDKTKIKIPAKELLSKLIIRNRNLDECNITISEKCDDNKSILLTTYESLLNNVVSPIWTERHGAAMCLEAFIRVLCSKRPKMDGNVCSNTLMELCYYSFVVLLLDKYGDYVACNVVAPVKESVAQLFGTLIHLMDPNDISKILSLLSNIFEINRDFKYGWQIVHSCLIATKYTLVVCKERGYDWDRELVEMIYNFFIKSFGDDENNMGMIIDDVLAETCTIMIILLEDYLSWPSSIEIKNVVMFITENTDQLDESCSALENVISLLIRLVNLLRTSIDINNDNNAKDFLLNNSITILKFLYNYAFIPSQDMQKLILEGTTTIICFNVIVNQNLTDNKTYLIATFWKHVYYMFYVVITTAEFECYKSLFHECIDRCVEHIGAQLCIDSSVYISIIMDLISYPLKKSIDTTNFNYKEQASSTSTLTQNDSNDHVPSYIAGLDRPASIDQYNFISYQRFTCVDAVVKIISKIVNIMRNNDDYLKIFGENIVAIIDNYINDNNSTKILLGYCFLYKISCTHNDFCAILHVHIKMRIQLYTNKYLPLVGMQDVFFCNSNECNYVIAEINKDIVKFFDDFVSNNDNTGRIAFLVKNSNTLRQAKSYFTSITEQVTLKCNNMKESIVTIINKINQLECMKYIYCSRIQLFFVLYLIFTKEYTEINVNNISWYIVPLMESIKFENDHSIYESTCMALIQFIKHHLINNDNIKNLLEKIFRNVCIYITNSYISNIPSTIETPIILSADQTNNNSTFTVDKMCGIFSICYHRYYITNDSKENGTYLCISNTIDSVKAGKKKTLTNSVVLIEMLLNSFYECLTLESLINDLISKPILCWDDSDETNCKILTNALTLFLHMYECLHKINHSKTIDILDRISDVLICSQWTCIRSFSGYVLGNILMSIDPIYAIYYVHNHFVSDETLPKEYGRTELMFYIVNLLNENNISLLPLSLIVHVVKNLMHPNQQISYMYSRILSLLMRYIPLFIDKCTQFVDKRDHQLTSEQQEYISTVECVLRQQLQFMRELSMPSSNKCLELPFELEAQLRPYQIDGINWLLFLQQYNLNGALCDDMGLGKTIQTIITIAYTHSLQKKQANNNIKCCSPTLIICPPILVEHWKDEFSRFLPLSLLNVIKFDDVNQSKMICKGLSNNEFDVVITSYNLMKNNIQKLKNYHFNYVVLDEAHLIKNNASKYFLAVKMLQSKYRLLLTGTPIQNNVTELWTLFDFLMPNFLGSYKSFTKLYARPIAKSFNTKCTSDNFMCGQKLLAILHKQILPFLLRRTKENVLKDLPDKIIQTIYCDMSLLQQSLYNSVLALQDTKLLESKLGDLSLDNDDESKSPHIFRLIHYLRRVCNHPAIALQNMDDIVGVDNHNRILSKHTQPLNDITVASKLVALMQLLEDCGIYSTATYLDDINLDIDSTTESINHRALIFSQTTSMLDIIERDLLKKHMPNVKYLRLDGTIRSTDRYPIAKEFNTNTEISILLLTTSVGSLGLNLVGADIVIFYDNDWNPMKDMQAMDRAHRIGQTKTVNVYRLVVKNTIEERILNLQSFKLKMANTVINDSNGDLATMKDNDIMDVFGNNLLDNNQEISNTNSSICAQKRDHSKLFNLYHKDYCNHDDYAKQYDMETFCKNLK